MPRHLTNGPAAGLWLIFWAAAACGSDLRAGLARASIPAERGSTLAGFRQPATGVHDPLQARALVLRSASASVAIVACDLHSFSSQRVAQEAKRRTGIELVLLACSGSFSAPGLPARWTGYEQWALRAEDAILDAIEKANANMFPARVGATTIAVDIAYNWRAIDEYGRLTMLWRNPERRPGGPVLKSAAVWRIEDQNGALRGVVFHTACRASTFHSDGQISADYPGVAVRRVEADLGGGVFGLFLQGASGNAVPYVNEQAGEVLGAAVARAARSIRVTAEPVCSLQTYRNPMKLRERWRKKDLVSTETATVVINRKLALASMPGAPFIEHQIALADRSPIPGTLLLGHTFAENSGWAGILPTIRGAAEGGYGASGGDTSLEVGAGEAMVDAALVNIYQALGKLDELPRGPLVRETPPEKILR